MSTLLAWSLLVSWRLLWANHHHHQFTREQLTVSCLSLAWSWAVCTMSSSEKCLFGLIYYISGLGLMQSLDASRLILLHAKKWLRNLSWHEMTVYSGLWATNLNSYFQALLLEGVGGGVHMSLSEFNPSLCCLFVTISSFIYFIFLLTHLSLCEGFWCLAISHNNLNLPTKKRKTSNSLKLTLRSRFTLAITSLWVVFGLSLHFIFIIVGVNFWLPQK